MVIVYDALSTLQKKSAMKKKERMFKALFDYHASTPPDRYSKFNKFFYKSHNHFFIVLLLASSSSEHAGYHYEEIVNMYPHLYASRTTIHSILNEGVENNFFIKNQNYTDHRKQNYKLSADQKKEMINWLDNNPMVNYN